MRKKLILTLLPIVIAFLAFTVVTYAWITISDAAQAGINNDVIDSVNEDLSMKIYDQSGTAVGDTVSMSLLPGEKEYFQITLTNTGGTALTFKNKLLNITSVRDVNATLPDSFYRAGRYIDLTTSEIVTTYTSGETELDIDETYFNNFITDAKETIKYYEGETLPTSVEWMGYLSDYVVEDDAISVVVDANSTKIVYIQFYFDPNVYATYNGVQLQNSNPFMYQTISTTISVEEV